MRWYLPTWNGDIRAESDGERTRLTIIKPTALELMTLGRLEHQMRERDAWSGPDPLWRSMKDGRRKEAKRQEVILDLPLGDLAPLLIETYKPGKQALTAIVYVDGEIETVDGTQGDKALAKAADKATKKGGKKAATVKRATPCCPACEPGSIEPATEVLLDFLDETEHATWAKDRYIIVRGGRTGHRYLIAHRHSERAVDIGRICFDLDDRTPVHFHDNSVPPEEEVLGAKLVLEHREDWLRNEATMIQPAFHSDGSLDFTTAASHVFKNPFGDGLDGVEDAGITQAVGAALMGLCHGLGIEGDYSMLFEEWDKGLEQLIEQADDPYDDDGMLNAAEHEFFDTAVQIGEHSPKALAHVALYWRRRASGVSPPDWEGA